MQQELEKARVYLFLKWIGLTVVLGVLTVEALLGYLSPAILAADYFGITLTVGLGLALEWLLRRGRTSAFIMLSGLLLDQTFVLTVIYFSGGPENSWWFLPVCLIFIAGYVFNASAAFLLAAFSSLVISLDFWLEYLALIPHHHALHVAHEYWRSPDYLSDYLLGMIMLYFLGALISSYFTRLMNQTTVKLQDSLQGSETARAELENSRKALLSVMEDLDQAKIGLEAKVTERTTELEKAKLDLETKITERTADLEESRRAILHMMKDLKDDIVKLQDVDKMKTEFLSMVSHELRTPLTPIKGYLTLLLSNKMGELSDPQRKALDILARQSEHLHSLIDSILDLSRIELGKPIPLSKEILSLRTVIEETVDAMKIQADEKKIKLLVEIAEDLPATSGDVIKLKRVLANLVGNAIKFTPDQGTIKIKAFPAAGQVRVEVSDNGLGLTRENLVHVFEKFYQVDSSITRAAGGMGMGLPIAKELIERHGGKIWLESAGLGKGTSAIFVLPVL
jgi:signal transduction histidine kinase